MNPQSHEASPPPDHGARYSKQERFAPIGVAGQQRLAEGTAVVVGCGALGSLSASLLVRAGVGTVRIVDRDFVELSNLQRQVLFDEKDAAEGSPKAVAAATKLRAVNSQVAIEAVVADVTHENIRQMAAGAGVIVDGTDNFETRLLINDYAVQSGTPWVYGGCLGAEGQVLTILPGQSACLTCLVPEPPAPGATPTCDTAGVLGPAVGVVASMQAAEAIKVLSGATEAVCRKLTVVDLWDSSTRQFDLANLHPPGSCPTCDDRQFPWLGGKLGSEAVTLCGRNAVQVRPAQAAKLDLPALATRLRPLGEVSSNPFFVRLKLPPHTVTIFADGRSIVAGSEDPIEAKALLARLLGA
ncbi:MAG: ThiF family adenylyltransferase [Planctomycetota bacterium]